MPRYKFKWRPKPNWQISSVCFAAFLTQLLAGPLFGVPPTQYAPEATQLLGRASYLTIHTNFLNTIYFGVYFWYTMFGSETLIKWISRLFPLSFGLGMFVTLAYYLLDHFEESNVVRKNNFMENGYPYVWLGAHLEHAMGLPISLLHALTLPIYRSAPVEPSSQYELRMKGRKSFVAPTELDVWLYSGGYFVFYALLTELNRSATGHWIYPIFDHIHTFGGEAGKNVFVLALGLVVVFFAHVGKWILYGQNGVDMDGRYFKPMSKAFRKGYSIGLLKGSKSMFSRGMFSRDYKDSRSDYPARQSAQVEQLLEDSRRQHKRRKEDELIRLRMRSGALTREEEERLLATGLAGLSGKGTNGSMTDQEIRNAADELQSLLASAQGGARGAIDPRVEELSRHDPKFTATAGSDANLRWRAKP